MRGASAYCTRCGYEAPYWKPLCERCGAPLLPGGGGDRFRLEVVNTGGVWRYRRLLYISQAGCRSAITMGEGSTPLLEAEVDGRRVLVKVESRNPTGSFIDRGSAVFVTLARCMGRRRVYIASLGDLGISAASYARLAGLKPVVYTPRNLPVNKLLQIQLLSAYLRLFDSYSEAIERGVERGREGELVAIPPAPAFVDGYRTISFELVEALGSSIDYVAVPVGTGTLAISLWKGFTDLGLDPPLILGVVPRRGSQYLYDVEAEIPFFHPVLRRLEARGGVRIIGVEQGEVFRAMVMLARSTGVVAEPSGVVALAGVLKALREGVVEGRGVVVVSGASFRDPVVLRKAVSYLGREAPPLSELLPMVGETKLRILEIVAIRGPIHPYAIWKLLREGYGLTISVKTIYTHLKRLEEAGLVERVGVDTRGRLRILYAATPLARELLQREYRSG